MRLVVVHARAEVLQLLRYPSYCVPTVLLPALLLLVFGRQLGGGEPERLVAGFAATAVLMVAFFQFGVGIATMRTTPWEAYLRTLPVGTARRLAARVLSALPFAAATVLVVIVVGRVVYDAEIELAGYVVLVATLLLGAIPFALLGIALGYLLPPRAALPVANLAYIVLAVGGALWRRPENVPRGADLASQLFPTRSWIEVLDPLTTGDGSVPARHVAALVGWSAVFGAAAWIGYRRDEGERFT